MEKTNFEVNIMYDCDNYKNEGIAINTNENGISGYVFVNKKTRSVLWLGKIENTKHIFAGVTFKRIAVDNKAELEYCKTLLEKYCVGFEEKDVKGKRRTSDLIFQRALIAWVLRKKRTYFKSNRRSY